MIRFIKSICPFLLLVPFAIADMNGQQDTSSFSFQKIFPVSEDHPLYMEDVAKEAEAYFSKNKAGYKQYKRMEDYMMSRLGEDGRIVNTTAKNYNAYVDYVQSHDNSNRMVTVHNGSWDFMGPSSNSYHLGVQGRVNRFAFHPTDENIIFAATAAGGVWKSNNKGVTWESITDGVPVLNSTGVAVDNTNPNILYMLSGDGDAVGELRSINEFSRPSIGVFKTVNGGTTWQPTGLVFAEPSFVLAYNLYISPEDNMTLYACTTLGLFRTQDGGENWDTIRLGKIYELEFKPGDADHLYCVDDNYLYVSDNAGTTWSDSTLIPPVDVNVVGRMVITTCADNPELVYLFASPLDTLKANDSIPDHRGFWRSLNSGADFTLLSTRPNIMAGSSGLEFKTQASYDLTLVCNPMDETEVLVGGIGIFMSNTSGVLWNYIDGINNTYHADIHSIQVNPLDQTTYVACDGGVFMSEDFGATFEYRSGFLANTTYYRIATSPFFSDFTIAGSQDCGVHLRDQVETEFDMVLWGDGMVSKFHPTIDSLVISSIQDGEIHMSRDTGHSFSLLLPKILGGDSTAWTTPIIFDASDDEVIYVGYKPIMKSTDQGETFFATSNDTISGHKLMENNLSNPSRVYAGDCKDCRGSNLTFEMYMSPDAGATWIHVDTSDGFPANNIYVTDAYVDPYNSQDIWITCGRFSAANKVFRSTNAGASWTNETGTLPNVPVNAVIVESNGAPSGAVYIATDIGVFYRNDDLGDWIYFSNNLPIVEVTDLDIDYIGGFLRASTYGRGMWESELFTECQPIISLNPSNQQLGLSYVHQAINHIFSTAHVDGYGSRVVYKSENEVHLTEGFSAKSGNGAFFKAVLTPCGSGGIESAVKDEPAGKL